MKRIISLTENDITRITKRVISEMDEESYDIPSTDEWVEIWFKLRKQHTSFAFPDGEVFNFGGLFFFYDNNDGCLKLPEQDPYEWRNDYDKGVEVLEKYYDRLTNIFDESGLGLSIDMGRDFSMTICKN
jgi:hypothetical protein